MKIRVTAEKGWYRNKLGEVFEVVGRNKYNTGWTVKVWKTDACEWDATTYFISDGSYEVVEDDTQPKVHEIDGKQYVEVERKAEVGEKIIISLGSGWYKNNVGNVYEVISGKSLGFSGLSEAVYVDHEDNNETRISCVVHSEYRVLEPVEQPEEELVTATEGNPKEMLDLVGNLARRVTELEQIVGQYNGLFRDLAHRLGENFTAKQVAEIIKALGVGAND